VRLNRLDLNQLVCLAALLEERSVTKAAKSVAIGQSAMSLALGRLREYFDDDIIVQVGRTMVPTPFGQGLAKPVHDILLQIKLLTEKRPGFDTALCDRTLNIVTSDYLTELFFSDLFRRAREVAPKMKFVLHELNRNMMDDFDRGEIDLLVIPDVISSKDHPSEFLFEETLSCVVWEHNTRVGDRLSLQEYLDLDHVTTEMDDDGLATIDRNIERLGYVRRSQLNVPNVMLAPKFVIGTQIVMTLQTRLARLLVKDLPLRMLPCPLNMPPVSEVVQWHKRLGHDPAINWFCGLLKDVSSELQAV
jgi:LysR family transcriptional regulator, nod-box dependent transcriptional activator